jgi:transposase-like protein
MRLHEIKGAPCPKCGCQDTERVQRWGRWGATSQRYQCRYCRTAFWADTEQAEEQNEPSGIDPDAPVAYQITHCPHCGSGCTKVTSTRKPIRHHKCMECGKTFKSHER